MALSPDGLKAGLQTPAFELQLGGETVPGAWPLVTAVAGAQIEKMRLLVQIPVDRHHHRKDRLPLAAKCLESGLQAVRNSTALSPDGLKAGLQTPAFELQLGGETVPGAWPSIGVTVLVGGTLRGLTKPAWRTGITLRPVFTMPSRPSFRAALQAEKPLQIAGAINAYAALLAQRAGFRALYLSGAGVANHSYGLPDIGKTRLEDVLIDVRRIAGRVELPLLVDIDTGWDDPTEAVQEMAKAGAAAVHLEDQVPAKLCGHLPGKHLVSTDEMVGRVKAAISGKPSADFVVMARTDAAANEGVEAAIARANAYVAAGADMIFAEALHTLDDYRAFAAGVSVPVLANLTEFGKTPYFTVSELDRAGIALILYPLSASRAAAHASAEVYSAIRRQGSQGSVVERMQTRASLYDILGYEPPK